MGIRPKMSREDRAKQFMPFAALKGYQEALRIKEKEMESKKDKRSEQEGESVDYPSNYF